MQLTVDSLYSLFGHHGNICVSVCHLLSEHVMWELIPTSTDWRGGQLCSITVTRLYSMFFPSFGILVLPCMWPAWHSCPVYNGLRYPTILWLPGVSLFHLGHHPVHGSHQGHFQICKKLPFYNTIITRYWGLIWCFKTCLILFFF